MCGMPESEIELSLPDAQATIQLGAALARCYLGGVRGTTVYVHGELGAGKTTCLRSLLRTLGVEGLIRSPTYTLVEVYEPRDLICVHVDLYRVHGPLEVEELDYAITSMRAVCCWWSGRREAAPRCRRRTW